jgi:pimeloyl-ACP methyl ester carboxylesterase
MEDIRGHKNLEASQLSQKHVNVAKTGRFSRILDTSLSALRELVARIMALFLEIIGVIMLSITQPFSLRAICDPTQKDVGNPKVVDPNQPPILMIHGFLGRSSNWIYHRKGLADKGLKNLFTVDLGSPHHSIEHYANVVSKRIEEIKKITGRDDVIIVCHSMGGLVADAYQKLYAQKNNTRILDTITLGTPLAGTRIAYLAALFSKSAKQMRPSSDFSRHRAMKATHRFVNKNGTKIWEQITIDKNGKKTTIRNEMTKDHQVTEIVKQEDPKKGMISTDLITQSPNGTIMTRHEDTPMKKPFASRTLHIGSRLDSIVPYESSVSQAFDVGVKSKIVQKGSGGHVWLLFSRDVHETVYDRIQRTIAKQGHEKKPSHPNVSAQKSSCKKLPKRCKSQSKYPIR